MKELKAYTIPFVGLKKGKHHFDYQIDKTFFLEFDYDEFNAANVNIDLFFDKKSTFLELEFKAEGFVNVNCDVTNEPFDLKIKDAFKLVIKFGEAYNDDNEEILIIPHGEYQINVAQYIYELIVLALPAKKVHPGIEDGTLQSDILKKLEELSPEEGKTEENNTEDTDPRWDTLKKLLTDK
ncbi:YceD family protein [Winogradskyella litorisediminis]|uniref:YceD family protein n=1 Tax=Winogradskyella litorisediminis TaxID=1156618 RepID=A0ABW3N7N9_9FLAO